MKKLFANFFHRLVRIYFLFFSSIESKEMLIDELIRRINLDVARYKYHMYTTVDNRAEIKKKLLIQIQIALEVLAFSKRSKKFLEFHALLGSAIKDSILFVFNNSNCST